LQYAQVTHGYEIQPRSTFEEESLKKEPFVTQGKIKVQEEEPTMVQGGDKEENEIILDLKEKEV